MIILYHGGMEEIPVPEIRKPKRGLDFGFGFYLTSSEKQAEDWVKRRIDKDSGQCGCISVYTFELEDAKKHLNILVFDAPTEEWLDFVMSNRINPEYAHSYDLVIGPVANDRVYTAFSLFEGGIIDKPTLIKELKTYRLIDQYLFHTPKSLLFLKFDHSITI